MKKFPLVLRGTDLNDVVQALCSCSQNLAFHHLKSIHCQLITSGFVRDAFVANKLIAMYSNFNCLDDAQLVFREMPKRNVASWTSLISAYTRSGNHQEALRIFSSMIQLKLEEPNRYTFSVALKACALSKNLATGKRIHEMILGTIMQLDTVLMNNLIEMYLKCGSMGDAREVFDNTFEKNSISWNILIDGYCRAGRMAEALNVFSQMTKRDTITWNSFIAGLANEDSSRALECVYMMHREECDLDEFTFPCVLKACGSLGCLALGKQMHCYMTKSGFLLSCFGGSALVDMYSKCGELKAAEEVFDELERVERSGLGLLGLCNSMISGYVHNGDNCSAIRLASRAHNTGLLLDFYSSGSILKACIHLLNLKLGNQVHGLIITSGYHLDSVISSILIDLYVKCGKIAEALRIFSTLPDKDFFAWSGLLSGCAQQGFNDLALSLFKEMISLNVLIDEFVISSVLKVCSSLTILEYGKQLHAYCVRNGYAFEGVTVTSLIDMYSKCGKINDSIKLFRGIDAKDTICWTGIIVGCGQNGRAHEAINFFQEMIKSGIRPNEITVLGVLSACRHARLVDEARDIFSSMRIDHGLVPQLEHYCCMVDLLGRAGLFDEVEQLITEMPYEANAAIWASLLGACDIHSNVQLGTVVAGRLLAISPADTSAFVTLSNTFARLGIWRESINLRKVNKRLGVKDAGRSWIETRV